MRFQSTLRAVAVASLALGCATAKPKKDVVWPDPPEVARIRFVTAFAHTEDLDTSGFAAFRRTLLGASGEQGLRQPMGLALSADGQRLYIADHALSAVMVADFTGKTLKRFAPDEPVGKPMGVAVDKAENVYISDTVAKVVRVFDKTGGRLRQIGAQNQFERPTGMAIDDARNRIYVCDSSRQHSQNHRVRVFDLEGKWLFDLGAKPGLPSRGSGEGQWHFPTYAALDADGNVFVSDSMNFRIQVYRPDGSFLRAFGENGDGPGFFSRLKGIAFDGFGNLYAVDGGHANVQLFNKNFDVLMFFGGYSQKLEYFDVPSGIAIDRKSNRIYVCNEFISRINVYELINTKPEDSQLKPPAPAAAPTP